jgi:hypothetical protein
VTSEPRVQKLQTSQYCAHGVHNRRKRWLDRPVSTLCAATVVPSSSGPCDPSVTPSCTTSKTFLRSSNGTISCHTADLPGRIWNRRHLAPLRIDCRSHCCHKAFVVALFDAISSHGGFSFRSSHNLIVGRMSSSTRCLLAISSCERASCWTAVVLLAVSASTALTEGFTPTLSTTQDVSSVTLALSQSYSFPTHLLPLLASLTSTASKLFGCLVTAPTHPGLIECPVNVCVSSRVKSWPRARVVGDEAGCELTVLQTVEVR